MKLLQTRIGGKIYKAKLGRAICSRYEGVFTHPELIAKADTGKWYACVSGNPFILEGEGDSVHAAVKNSIERTKSRIKRMQEGIDMITTDMVS